MSTVNLQNNSMSTMENKQVTNNIEIQPISQSTIIDNSSTNYTMPQNQGKDTTIEPAYFARATQISEIIHNSIEDRLLTLETTSDEHSSSLSTIIEVLQIDQANLDSGATVSGVVNEIYNLKTYVNDTVAKDADYSKSQLETNVLPALTSIYKWIWGDSGITETTDLNSRITVLENNTLTEISEDKINEICQYTTTL